MKHGSNYERIETNLLEWEISRDLTLTTSQPPTCSTLPWSLVKGANLKTVSEN
jgi:hypothetical protein